MKLEIDIPDEKLRSVVGRALTDGYVWQNAVKELACRFAREQVEVLPVERLVREFIEAKTTTILEDAVYKQLRHVVKIAVDKELSAAREIVAEKDV